MGILYIVATPIGNLEDITIRAIKILLSADYIVCEDTRVTGNLIQNLELKIRNHEFIIKDLVIKKPRLISYYDEIEFKRVPEIIELLKNDKNVALVSDSGTPLISDPGFKLVKECVKRGVKVVSIPGPSSVIAALTSSGLPPNDFRFLGYLPPGKTHRQKLLKSILFGVRPDSQLYTIIVFETSRRLKESLQDLQEIFGDMEIVIARELTKIHEEIWRGKTSEAIEKDFIGEIVILFSGRV